jgi:phosphoribosylformylglycinamidine synthase subunit PurSL
MGTDVYRFVVKPKTGNDPHSIAYLSDARSLGLSQIEEIKVSDIYFIEGSLSEADQQTLAYTLLADPIIQEAHCRRINPVEGDLTTKTLDACFSVEVAYHPGVTDPVAEQIVRAAHILGIDTVQRAATGKQFSIRGRGLSRGFIDQFAARFLSNPTIQSYVIGEITPVFPLQAESTSDVTFFSIRGYDPAQLLNLSKDRRAALDLAEMQAIQDYYQAEGREISDIEFETLAQTWSEHCGHKTFKALITIENPADSREGAWQQQKTVDGLLRSYLRASTDNISPWWLRSAFVDNAGIVDFDDGFEVSFKVETHNHPSAIEPFGGANTGVGGVIRDVIGVSAKPIAATDVLCFGPADQALDDLPGGVLHPRRIRSGVVAGVQDYGNKIGIPTVSGAILYDPGYTANPLVFCGCVGLARKDSHANTPRPGDRVIVLGGKTGRDGLRGATFSSMTMDAQTGQVAGASVQIGAPIVEKGLIDVILIARDQQLYHAITDCGAGGLSSAVGEMASSIGADVNLKLVSLKYPGLAPWEIWLSEAQERMVLAVGPDCVAPVQQLCQTYGVDFIDMGIFTDAGRLVVRYGDEVVLNLHNAFLHDGIPQRKYPAVLPKIQPKVYTPQAVDIDYAGTLAALLAQPNIASKENVIRIYDHEVQGGTVVKPLTGAKDDGPSDAVVIKPIGTPGTTAIVLGAGINPEYGKHDPYNMALSAVDESIRNLVCSGGDPERIALLDNFCWGDPNTPATLGTLVEAVRGCHDAAMLYRAPFISGKDSLNNEYFGTDGQRHAIPPTLLISSLSVIGDLYQTVTMDLKSPADPVYLVGDFHPRFQGSHYAKVKAAVFEDGIPGRPENAVGVYRLIHQTMKDGWVAACHDLSEGGLLVCAAEMCIGGRLGMEIAIEPGDPIRTCFGETNGSLLVEVKAEHAREFEQRFAAFPMRQLGQTNRTAALIVTQEKEILLRSSVEDLTHAWKSNQ